MKRALPILGLLSVAGFAAWWFIPREAPPTRTKQMLFSKAGPMKSVIGFGGNEQLRPPPTGPIPDGQRLLIVTWDTVRADHTSAYGYGRDTTPTLSALAARGARFADFIVPQSTTLPTHVSMFTGTHPEEHGVIGNSAGGAYAFVPPDSLPTIAGHLDQHGYITAGFVSSAPLKKYSGISSGFQVWSEPPIQSRSAMATTAQALTWLESVDEDRPWLLWLHLYDPHAPYRAPKAMHGSLGDYDFAPGLAEQQLENNPRWNTALLTKWREQYDLEILAIDRALGDIVEVVEARFPDTVITVIGDHGEGLGQHNHKEHGLTWPEQLLAPWVVVAPGLDAIVVQEPTTASDLLPTLAAVATLPAESALLQRTSGLDALAPIPADRAILSRTSARQLQKLQKTAHLDRLAWSLTTTDWHYVWYPEQAGQLFERADDPGSLNNVATDRPNEVEAFAAQVASMRKQMHQTAETLGAGRTKALAAETAEELKALGYLH